MEKEKVKKFDCGYWLTINFYRWEFLRRSKEYRDFYKRIKNDYLIPLKKFDAALKKAGLNINRIHASKLMPVGPSDLVEQKRNLQTANKALREEVYNKFGLSWCLMEKHYPREMLNPNKTISRDAIVFADYQQYSSCYNSLVFQPHIKRITNMPAGDFENYRVLNPTYEIFAVSTWGEPHVSDEAMKVIAEYIKETFELYPSKQSVMNPFLLAPCKPIRGETLKLQEQKLAAHWDELLKTWDLIEKAKKATRTKNDAMFIAAEQLYISHEAVRSRLRQVSKLITEAAQARFYTSRK